MPALVLWERSVPRMPLSPMVLRRSMTLVRPCRRTRTLARLIPIRPSPPFARLARRLLVASRTTSLLPGLVGSAQDLRALPDTLPAVRSTQAPRHPAILRRQATLLRRLAWVSLALSSTAHHRGSRRLVLRSFQHLLLTRLHRRRMGLPRRHRPTLRRRLGSRLPRPTTVRRLQASARLLLLSVLRHQATVQPVQLLVAPAGTSLPPLLRLRSTLLLLLAGLLRVPSSILLLRPTLLARQRRQEDRLLLDTAPRRQLTALRKSLLFLCFCTSCKACLLTF